MARERRICATMPHHFQMAATDEDYRTRRRQIEQFTRTARIAPQSRVATIPVVVHVLYHDEAENLSLAQVQSQIDVLNRDFRGHNEDRNTLPAVFAKDIGDARIEFALARRDPRGQPSDGITRTRTAVVEFPYDGSASATAQLDAMIKLAPAGVAAWPRDDYLNLWVCPLGGGLLGYAQFPGGAAATDGVVIRSTAFGTVGNVMPHYDLGRTCVHEVGHWFNLLHIWGDDGDGCRNSDSIADTPNQGGPNEGTPVFPVISCGNGPDGDMFMNYMDYVDDAAMVLFTRGQVERMDAALAGPRAPLLVSAGLVAPGTEAAGGSPVQRGSDLLLAFAPPGQKIFDGVNWI